MNSSLFSLTTRAAPAWVACLASCLCGASHSSAQEAVAKEAAAEDTPAEAANKEAAEPSKTEADYRNWFDVSVGGNFIKGDAAAFKQRHGLPQDVYGGVSQFHYEQDVGKNGLFEVDGHGIFDNNDYSFRLSLEDPDWGYVRAGYREFRTWYDGSGGYFPRTETFLELYSDELAVDRGEAFFEAGLLLPEHPQIRFRYSHQFRDGRKNSTSWGDSQPPGFGDRRNVVPTFLGIDEDRHVIELDAEHTIKDTRVGTGFRYELSEQENTRNIHRRPGEASDRYLTQRDEVETDLFHARAFTETWFNEKVLFTTGYAFTTMDTDIGGYRVYGTDYAEEDADLRRYLALARNPATRPVLHLQNNDEGFHSLTGGSKLQQHVLNLNLMITPFENFTIVPSLRAESLDHEGYAEFEETNFSNNNFIEEPFLNESDREWIDVSEGLELRYTGFTNWVLYTRGEWLQGEGDVSERQFVIEHDLAPEIQNVSRDTESQRFTQKYVFGANWYPLSRINLAAQYYHKRRENEYDHPFDLTSNISDNRYPAYIRNQDFETDDVNLRVTFRPIAKVTLVTRYDFQISTIESQMDRLSGIESADYNTHIIAQSVSWVPINRLYLQGSVNYVIDKLETPAVSNIPGTNVVANAENDYITANATVGFALTEKTDLEAQYLFYKSHNWEGTQVVSVPYLSSAEEHGITAAIIHRISAAMQVSLRYGWFTSSDETSGGRNDYEAHMVASTFRYRF